MANFSTCTTTQHRININNRTKGKQKRREWKEIYYTKFPYFDSVVVVRWLTTTRGLGTLECRTDEVIVHNALCFNSDGRRPRLVAGDGEPLGAVSVVAITEPPVPLTTFYGHDYRCFAFFLFLTLFHILTYCSHNFCFIPSPLKFPPQSPFQSPLIFMLNN